MEQDIQGKIAYVAPLIISCDLIVEQGFANSIPNGWDMGDLGDNDGGSWD